MKISQRLTAFSKRLYHHVFPRKILIDKGTQAIMEGIYPNLNFQKIHLFEGLPWFLGHFASGICLPATYSTSKVHIYLKDWQPKTEQGAAILVHELFHALQYHDLAKARGIGFLRLFMVHYLSNYLKLLIHYLPKHGYGVADRLAYLNHPMEKPAFAFEEEFLYWYRTIGRRGLSIEVPAACVRQASGYNTSRSGWLIAGWFLGSVLMISKPFIELFFLISAGFLRVVAVFLKILRL